VKGRRGAGGDAAGDGSRGSGDDDEGLQVSAMRAVWLTMRDEEPPEGGMASLLAAARAKAAAMRPPSWWRRALAALHRPQVLAFATVVVLLGGGAVVVGRRGEAPAFQRDDDAERAGRPVPRAPAPSQDTRSAPKAALAAPTITERTSVAMPAKPAPAPAPVSARPGAGPAGSAPAGAGSPDARGDAPVPIGGLAMPTPGGEGASGELTIERVAAPPPAAVKQQRSPVAHRAGPARAVYGASAAMADGDEVSAVPAASEEAGEPRRLAGDCETAASRGDCVTVRRLVGKITRTDRSYRARLAKDSAVAKCLAE